MNRRNKHKCLVKIDVFEFTGNDIGELRNQFQHDRYLSKVLPRFCVNEQFGNITESDGFLQFVDSGDEKFLMFDLETIDLLLTEEISGGGWDQIFKQIDIKPYLKEFKKLTFKDLGLRLNSAEYLILELEYVSGGYYDPDFELNVSINGAFLGNDLHYFRA